MKNLTVASDNNVKKVLSAFNNANSGVAYLPKLLVKIVSVGVVIE